MRLIPKTLPFFILICCFSCTTTSNSLDENRLEKSASELLGDPEYLAMSYGGYRQNTRDVQPTIEELKEDMQILYAMGVRVIRTYNVHLAQAENVLKAINELEEEIPDFEMYVMLGAWIDCKNAWTGEEPIHNQESERNAVEIATIVELATSYPAIVKMIAVGNESMVKWATAYYVEPQIILKWVTHLQNLKTEGVLPSDLWITSSDNFASWGGGEEQYHVDELTALIKAVDFISLHTYPMHDTHYNPSFWGLKEEESQLSKQEQVDVIMNRSLAYAKSQYNAVKEYIEFLGVDKPIHIGETGWATTDNHLYGNDGSMACDEYKAGVYYKKIREWTNQESISCFYFEAFDESWKDANNKGGSENHFGLFTVDGQAKYGIWDIVDQSKFEGLSRGGNQVKKTADGNEERIIILPIEHPAMNTSL